MKLLLILSFSLLISNSYSELSPKTGAKETISFFNELITSDLVKEFTVKFGNHLQKKLLFSGSLGNYAFLILILIKVHQDETIDILNNLAVKLDKLEHKLDVMSDQVSTDIFNKFLIKNKKKTARMNSF